MNKHMWIYSIFSVITAFFMKGKKTEEGSFVETGIDSNTKVSNEFGFSGYLLQINKNPWYTEYDRINIVQGNYMDDC